MPPFRFEKELEKFYRGNYTRRLVAIMARLRNLISRQNLRAGTGLRCFDRIFVEKQKN